MDVRDVSKDPQYLEHLQKYQQMLADAQAHEGEHPENMKSPQGLILDFTIKQMLYDRIPANAYHFRTSFMPPLYAPCITPFEDLKKATIKDFTFETHHRGFYILLKAVTSPLKQTSIMVIAEDEDGKVLLLQLYNQEDQIMSDGRLAEGTVILVKEPYLKFMADGQCGIRVDHLSDIKFLPEHDGLVPLAWRPQIMEEDITANDWKIKGNDLFNKGSYYLAIECYSKALYSSPTHEEALTIKLNRVLAYLHTSQFEAALRDAETMTDSEQSEKALFRKAQALYHLRRFRESCEVFAVLAREYPENDAARAEFNRAIARLAEQERGNYQFDRLQLEVERRRPPLLDHATYVGPVCVKLTESRGRGLFTTEGVRAGDLLLCEKAFAYAFHDGELPSLGLFLTVNANEKTMTLGTQLDLVSMIVQKLHKNPSQMETFNSLYSGSYKSVEVGEVDGLPIVDTFLAERIMSLNCFGFPRSSRETHIRSTSEREEQRITFHDEFLSCGFWLLASYINHSCYSNAHRSFIGDMMIIRASQDIEPNTEITISYKSPLAKDSMEGRIDLQHWGFECDCIICQVSKKTEDTKLAQRKKFRDDILEAFRSDNKPGIKEIKNMIMALEETYTHPAAEVPRLSIWEGYLKLAGLYAACGHPQKVIEFALKVLESLGYIIEGGDIPHTPGTRLIVKKWGFIADPLIECWMMLFSGYRLLAPDLADAALGYAKLCFKICVGEDETFDTYMTSFQGF
ncbi:hypothetical protein PHISCL_00095 [Aspergillus sclerotialis]|uniref:SET domain-containing protein n=1 Tax=Aspergillus sclerotialis TaxID=2070753 RepID=A0A3A2ZWH7_9EURO|nr:hypothetical protein PHISCL_00095 [Aspergillus sclerotialis]